MIGTDTPDPGKEVPKNEAQPVLSRFIQKFRVKDASIPSNLPTACILKGIKNPGILNSSNFLRYENVYLFYEYTGQLVIASAREITEYFNKKQPWEDYDFCVFDFEMRWCIGVTHNDDVIVADPDHLLY